MGKNSLYQFPYSPTDFNRYSATIGAWAGITADFPLVPNSLSLFIAPTYNQKGHKYLLQKETGANNTIKDSSFSQNIKYVDLNINLRKKFMFQETNSFFAGTGPVVSFLTSGKEQMQLNYFGNTLPTVNNTNNKLIQGNGPGMYKSVFLSWGFALGFQINNFSVWINGNIPLDNYYQDAANKVNHKIKTLGINTSYTFLTRRKKDKAERKEKREERKEEKVIADLPVVIVRDSLTDTDGDGITDINDRCPGHKGTLKYFGCPIPDTDGDGINDDDDKCVNVAGVAVNNGCPAFIDTIKPPNKDTACYIVYFEPGKSILRSEAYNTLATVIQQLKANPKLVATFTGHTDNVGSVEANFKRSLGRASVCADHVASYYISKDRLTVVSVGNKKPAADLNDPLLQWKNRRVEICVFELKE